MPNKKKKTLPGDVPQRTEDHGKSTSDFYDLKTEAVDKLVNASKDSVPKVSDEEIAKVSGKKKFRIPNIVKVMFIKFWFHGDGTEDGARDNHVKFCEAILENMSDRVTDGVNFCYIEYKGGTHSYSCWLPEMYNCLRVFFK